MKNGLNFVILMDELKKVLKRKKIKYTQIADEMDMSESSIKRLMSAKDAPLSKIEGICEVAGITFFDLVSLAQGDKAKEYVLSKEQESFFNKNTHYFFFFSHMYEHELSVVQMKKKFNLNDKSMTKYLKKLEELDLLERHPNDKIIWLFSGRISLKGTSGLGSHLFNTSLRNLTDIATDQKKLKAALNNRKGNFSMGDVYLRKESAEKLMQEQEEFIQSLHKISDRESRIFERHDLVKYTEISGILPLSLYFEDLPNL